MPPHVTRAVTRFRSQPVTIRHELDSKGRTTVFL